MTKAAVGIVAAGFAVANDAAEHQALTAQGYEPKFVAPPIVDDLDTKDEVMAALDKAGIDYDKRSSIEKLKGLLPK